MTTRLLPIFKRLKKALVELLIAATPAAALFIPFDTWAQVQTQGWPNRIVKIAVTGSPGGGPDLVARLLAEHLSAMWGQSVMIDNRTPGPGGNLAAQSVARATPDGYTVMLGINPVLAMNQYLFKSTGFDAERDFVPIIRIGVAPMMISVNATLPIHTLADLVAFSKSQPGKVFYATPGTRFLPEFVGEAFNRMAGAGLTIVPHKTGALAGQNTAGGETQAYIDSIAATTPWISNGRLRPIAVFGPSRAPGHEQVPTARESGFDVSMPAWMSLVAPTGTPREILDRINKDANTVLARPDVVARMRNFGMADLGGSIRDFEIFLASERKFWDTYVRVHNVEKE
jgi:tripartite-type tricarboxylate transporter receptor subunit TctC